MDLSPEQLLQITDKALDQLVAPALASSREASYLRSALVALRCAVAKLEFEHELVGNGVKVCGEILARAIALRAGPPSLLGSKELGRDLARAAGGNALAGEALRALNTRLQSSLNDLIVWLYQDAGRASPHRPELLQALETYRRALLAEQEAIYERATANGIF